MREKYESLSVTVLKDLLKSLGVKGISSLKKSEMVDILVEKEASSNNSIENGATDIKNDTNSKNSVASETQSDKNDKQTDMVEKSNKAGKKVALKKKDANTDKSSVNKGKKTISIAGKKENSTDKITIQDTSNEVESYINEASDTVMTEELPASSVSSNIKNSGDITVKDDNSNSMDSGLTVTGVLEIMPDGFGFIRSGNYYPGENDVYVSPGQIRKFRIKTGDIITGNTKVKSQSEKFAALLYIKSVNGFSLDEIAGRRNFDEMTPIFPNEKIRLDIPGAPVSTRIMDLISPVGKGQRGMIVSPPKAGKTTLLKSVAKCVKHSQPAMHMIILLIDERPEEVTDIKEAIKGPNVEVVYSTFDETPEHHKRVAELVIERARRLVEHGRDVIILLDSITRLTRAYNQVIPPSGRTLSGGLDPAALHMPKRFFGAARNMREGGSITILATALVDTGSKMDDVVYEEFKGTGNMEMVLDRKLSEKRVFPAIDIPKSGTRRDDLLLTPEELDAINGMRKSFNGNKSDDFIDMIIDLFQKTKNNREFVEWVKKSLMQ